MVSKSLNWNILGPAPALEAPAGLARAACRILLGAMYRHTDPANAVPADCAGCIEVPVQAGWLTPDEAACRYYAGGEFASQVTDMCSDESLARAQETVLEAAFSHKAPLADAIADLLMMAEGRVPVRLLQNRRIVRGGEFFAARISFFEEFLLSSAWGAVAPALGVLIGPIISEETGMTVLSSHGLLAVGELISDATVDGMDIRHFVRTSGYYGQAGWATFTRVPDTFKPEETANALGRASLPRVYWPADSIRKGAVVCMDVITSRAASIAYWPARNLPDLKSRAQAIWRAAYGLENETLADAIRATVKEQVELHEVGHMKSDAVQRDYTERLSPEKWWMYHTSIDEMFAEAFAMEKLAIRQDTIGWWAAVARNSIFLPRDLTTFEWDRWDSYGSTVHCLAALFQSDPSAWLYDMIDRTCDALATRDVPAFRAWMSETLRQSAEVCLRGLERHLGQ